MKVGIRILSEVDDRINVEALLEAEDEHDQKLMIDAEHNKEVCKILHDRVELEVNRKYPNYILSKVLNTFYFPPEMTLELKRMEF